MPSHLTCPQSHLTHSMCRVPRMGSLDIQWVPKKRDTLRRYRICVLVSWHDPHTWQCPMGTSGHIPVQADGWPF